MKDDRLISLNAAIDAMMKLQTEDIEAYGASIPEGFDGDRAVAALKALPSATDTNVGGTDTISRQAALDAVDDIHQEHLYKQIGDKDTYTPYNEGWSDACDRIDAALSALPSAQLAQDLPKGCTDTISRQAMIDAVDGVDWYHQNQHGEMVHGANSDEHQAWYKADDIYKAIEGVPPAQPELIEKMAYIRGFEQGRTQGMIDSQGGKK